MVLCFLLGHFMCWRHYHSLIGRMLTESFVKAVTEGQEYTLGRVDAIRELMNVPESHESNVIRKELEERRQERKQKEKEIEEKKD